MEKNLNKRITKTATSWKTRAKKDRDNRKNISRTQAFALDLLAYMELNGLKQKDVAKKMKVSPQQVNKILRAKSNITFETLDKIADALGVVVSSPKIVAPKTRMQSKVLQSSMQIIHSSGKKKKIEEDIITDKIFKENALLNGDLQAMNGYNYTAVKI
jgi:transcriptional regulator with XRE-family HTH domain|tara:strand:- start:592 stop:1065 length:474 start_codon:yes stop_codon:yes gene_type:complete